MASYLDFLNDINKSFIHSASRTGKAFDINDYNLEDIKKTIKETEGDPDIQLVNLYEHGLAIKRMLAERDMAPADYYDAHKITTSHRINYYGKLAIKAAALGLA